MAGREIIVKKYVVKLSEDERRRLDELIHTGKRPAQQIMKARILLKADAGEAGEGWSDSRIVEALETSLSTVYRTRQQLVEEGIEAVLSGKQRANSAVRRIFDGEAEARLIALACSEPPPGRARWSLRLLEEKVVELHIVERASDNTPATTWLGGRSKKHSQAASAATMGDPAGREQRIRSRHGGCVGGLHTAARSRPSRGLPGRNFQAAHQGNPAAGCDEARSARAGRL